MEKGYLSFVLHAHLPYVRHPEYEHFLEEDWYYEAITETYIPLISMFEGLVNDNVDFRMTMSLTPPLLSMFVDPLLQDRYLRHINMLIDLANKEVDRTKHEPHFQRTAVMYREKFNHSKWIFEKYGKNLANAFRKFMDLGKLEVVTCTATHGFLPLLNVRPEVVEAQVAVGVQTYEKYLGRKPKGIWLGECAFFPGLDEVLKRHGIKYFFVDTHGVLNGSSRPKYGPYAPVYCPSGVAAFGRDHESSKQVWSAQEGYPGDVNYRDFYRDVGFDLGMDYVKPYIHPDGLRKMTGVKYYKITGKTDHKEPYNHHVAHERASSHASNFMFNREKQVEHLNSLMGGRQPIILAPYDAELFGHWWYEGPDWMNYLIRKIHHDQNTFKLITPSEYLEKYPKNQVSMPSASSWGNKGYYEVWLNGSNDWVYRHLHEIGDRMVELANTYHDPDDNLRRALNQCARELLLAQASDWAFIMNSGTMVPYAVKRTKDHVYRFNKIYDGIKNLCLDMGFVSEVESRDNIFPFVDYAIYRSK